MTIMLLPCPALITKKSGHFTSQKISYRNSRSIQCRRNGKVSEISYMTRPRRFMGVGGQRHAPAASSPGKTRYPLHKRMGGPQDRSGEVQKISTPTGIRSPDRPVCSESLYRLRNPGPHMPRRMN